MPFFRHLLENPDSRICDVHVGPAADATEPWWKTSRHTGPPLLTPRFPLSEQAMSSSPGLSRKLEPSCELSATTILRGFLRYLPPAIATRPSDITGYSVDATGKAVLSLVSSARNGRGLPLPLAEGRAKSPWPSKPRRDGGVDAAAQRRPSFPLKIRGNLVSPDRSVALWDFSRRMVRQVGGALFAGHYYTATTLARLDGAVLGTATALCIL